MKWIKNIFLASLLVSCAFCGFSQAEVPDSIVDMIQVPEQFPIDTIAEPSKQPVIDSPIDYNSVDSMAISLENGQQIVHLYGGATIKYGTINLEADYISMNFEEKEIYASVMRDSLGNIVKKTKFSEGSETFECETLRYNFVTGKGFVENVVTEQQDGLVRSSKAKMMNKDVYCMVDGKYSTCDAEHPHFYLQMTKGKVLREKAIITGRSYLVLEDFPIYVPFLPYGYIPTNKKTYSSGVIIPSYGEETQYGFYLRDGGFYWAASDYFDLRLTGDIYSKGKWAINTNTRYRIRYKFSGSFGFSYSQNVTGERGINQKKSPSFRINWSQSQDSKANPSQTFQASVNFSSSGFNKENEFDNFDKFFENSAKSTVSYQKVFLNTPLSISTSFSIDQNMRDTTLSVSLPSFVFRMKTLYPFKNKNR
ncbi:MAG TPA: putative LPS assembly protein LptD, partial [Prolixibacteraceae bacterium]|nr:putative LPS assembly protein LptD [Prolixibacteraceae bacterium]